MFGPITLLLSLLRDAFPPTERAFWEAHRARPETSVILSGAIGNGIYFQFKGYDPEYWPNREGAANA